MERILLERTGRGDGAADEGGLMKIYLAMLLFGTLLTAIRARPAARPR